MAGTARREIRQLPDGPVEEVGEILRELKIDPFGLQPKQLEGYDNLFSIRFYFGQYRMVCSISESRRKVFIRRIRHRSTAYEGLKQPS